MLTRLSLVTAVLLGLLGPAGAAPPEGKQPGPVRFLLHGNMSHELPTEEYLEFVERVRPDVLVMGVFDQRLYSVAAPAGKGKPAGNPAELLARWQAVAERLHRSNIRLVGQMELFAVSDRPEELPQGAGWFGYHDRLWDEKLLGPRPAARAADLLEEPDLEHGTPKGPDIVARCGCRVNPRALNACVNKPAWRATQKAMVRAALARGIDGFLTNRNYIGHCACADCAKQFRLWLGQRFTPAQLADQLGIRDLASHPLCVVGAHREHDRAPSALELEKQRFARQAIKAFFDEVYVEHAHALRPGAVAGQWNHMAYFDELHLDRGHLPPSTRTNFAHASADERWGLPADRWGRGESLLWYCNWGTTQNTILAREYAGDTVLYGKLLRSLARGTPYVINKYDFYRPRNLIAEAAALGYATNAIATPWQAPEDRATVVRWFDFLRKHADLGDRAGSLAEVGLVFPRRALHAGDASALEYVEAAGRALVRRHALFDVLPDDLLATWPLEPYQALIVAAPEFLEEGERQALARYTARGGKLLWLRVSREDRDRPGAATDLARRQAERAAPFGGPVMTVEQARTDRQRFLDALDAALGGAGRLSSLDAPWTVEFHAYRQDQPRRLVLHLVNYNHDEKGKGASVTAREAPIAAEPVRVRLRLPAGFRPASIRFLSPDDDREHTVPFTLEEGRLEFRTPGFLVYGVCVIAG